MPAIPRKDFLTCDWTCAHCHRSGWIDVFTYPNESAQATANRVMRQTRDRCVAGCQFQADAQSAIPDPGEPK